nr:actin-related protein 10 [Leptinotarsa decemlineata]
MPIFETLSSDKQIVVLDIGAAYTKFGFSGEFSPRTIIKSEVRCKTSKQFRRVWNYKSAEDLYDLLVDFMHSIFFKYALVSPKDRAVIIVESLLCPTLFRETLAKVLFSHYEIAMLLTLPSHLVSLSSLAVETAMVVDVGYKEAVVIPVCHGLPIIQAWQALPIAAEAVHNNLRSLLSSKNTGVQNLSEAVLEDIKIRCCFVTEKSRAEQLALVKPGIIPCPEVKFPVGGTDSVIVTGKVRERAFEVLYEEDNDHLCLSTMILDAILQTDIDLRQKLADNLLMIGGTTMTPGFKARLKEELEKQLKCNRYSKLNIKSFAFHDLPCKENYAAWLGGAIYGATELLNMKAVTKEMYFKENRLPDWINLRDNVRTL